MGRGRRPNMALEPTRALQTQRAFRQRKADHLASLQDSIDQLTKENNRFRQLLRLESRHESEHQPSERSTPSRLPSETATGCIDEEEQTVEETKQQLAIAANHVEQQMTQLYQTLKVLRSLIESNSASADILHGTSSLSKISVLGDADDRRVNKKAKTAKEYNSSSDNEGATYTSPAAVDRPSNVNGISMTSSFYSPTLAMNATDRTSRHLPAPHMYSQNDVSTGSSRHSPGQAAGASTSIRSASWHSPSGSTASSAVYNRDAHVANGRHHHLGQQSATRTPISPVDASSSSSPKHSPMHYSAIKSEYHQSRAQQPQHIQQQQHTFHHATNSHPYPASNGESASYSPTRGLALQALNSPHSRHAYAMNECLAGPSPSPSFGDTLSSSCSHKPGSTASATPTLPHLAPASDGTADQKACCTSKSTTNNVTQSPPLGISVDMKTQMPNGEPCCFGLVECDDQGRIII